MWIGLPNLSARLLLVIGQDVSGLIDQCIRIFDGRPQSRRTLQGPGENLLQVP